MQQAFPQSMGNVKVIETPSRATVYNIMEAKVFLLRTREGQ